MRVSRAVVDCLVANGIDTVFGIPGKQSLPLNEAIDDDDSLRFVTARHETAVSHQAWGYAETSGEMAGTVVVPGPGDMNAMNGLKNALNDCTPLLHVAIETEPELRGGDAIHETPPDTYDNVVKRNVVVKNPESTLVEVQRAIEAAKTPPMGPVRVGIPKNYLPMDVALADPGSRTRSASRSPPDEAIENAAERLAASERPIIVAGGGIRSAEASEELRAVAERLDAPVVTTYKGKGVLPGAHELCIGALGGSASTELLACIGESDVALAVGTDLDALATRGWSVEVPESLIHVTLDAGDLGTGYEPELGIVADARETLTELDSSLRERAVRSAGDRSRANDVNTKTETRLERLVGSTPPITSVEALRTVREVLPDETIVTADAGGSKVWALNAFDASGPRRYVNPGSWATMGTGLPSAIGAQLANPDSPVVSLTGDGGLMMCVHELHTAVSEDLPITVIVLNNADYAIISEEAERNYELQPQEYGWSHAPIDFSSVAAGMGMQTARADAPEEIREEVTRAVGTDEPVLVETKTDPAEPQATAWMQD
ncbi:acetolactate synthase-1/2/3 large subunit [Halopelagius inordinatus]|uniref:Acetolactate synthase-1/2/3 large subunit n=1 Tax=Halopelagius inordinatus TaxID=553467 RepID=A0A1I2VN68_9EURY|nr:thiamine pyrophosphate-binding protein [Halopelagius inordinatus]SFG90592.1 acetolactate synthase-1/2/3 large subunit [Halopelagius inordinatus]